MCTKEECEMSRFYMGNGRMELEEAEISDTPLRGSVTRIPRVRFLQKNQPLFFEPKEEESRYSVKTLTGTVKNPVVPLSRETCRFDRFVPCRRDLNVEAANHSLKKEFVEKVKPTYLEVFEQIKVLSDKFQQRLMRRKLESENLMKNPDRILGKVKRREDEKTLPGSWVGRPKDLCDAEYHEDAVWPVHPRRRPVVMHSNHAHLLQQPSLKDHPNKQRIDWSSKNLLTVYVDDRVFVYNMNQESVGFKELIDVQDCCSFKWNQAGDKLALTHGIVPSVSLYDGYTAKRLWNTKCTCVQFQRPCEINCIAWSQNDQKIVTGCSTMVSIYCANSGNKVIVIQCTVGKIRSLSFSPNFRSLVTTGSDYSVQIHDGRSMVPYFKIEYYNEIKGVAWHPYKDGLLCIGGGKYDGSLALWNMNTSKHLSRRMVQFYGSVEHLLWNKHSAELVVNWCYWDSNQRRRSILPVLSCLDQVIDDLKFKSSFRASSILWNPNQTLLAAQSKDCIIMWDFLGTGKCCKRRSTKDKFNFNDRDVDSFKHYNIR
ncbi:protein cortex-like [Prorops nasuta]|uniref:protein cortex-like n=1 Tax=Prorops nasuta TaxID=863751 RepID=UPI0034CEFAFA